MNVGLHGKVAMVAGASRGLGHGVARMLAREGALVSMASRDEEAIRGAAERIAQETGTQTLGSALDLRDANAVAAWHSATVDAFGGVDLLFANTGGPPAGTTLSFDDEAWRDAFDLLVLSVLRMVRLVVPTMHARGGGAIVFSTSSAVKEPIANLALSNIVRASVAAMSKTLANELAPQGIRVNQLLPGRIDTDRVRHLDALRSEATGVPPADVRSRFEQAIPLGRYGDPDEFGQAAVFLLSDAARYITGASLHCDGGAIKSVY